MRTLRSAANVTKRAKTGSPVPSPQLNLSPVAVVKTIVPRRINVLKRRRNKRSIEITAIGDTPGGLIFPAVNLTQRGPTGFPRSEERRVGKERSTGASRERS